ncbi:NAD-dependent epimerase/dehydratase family protein [Candidatus Micrarchaeota archaeon]|nr:NAD-dependent epimerase/dehydratase family protein [Candidatus Micrarchaeota archaeon]
MPPKNKNWEKKIYITGATGRLGRAVFALVDGAIPLVRSASGLKNEIVTDFSEGQLKRILNDAATVIHLAGSLDMLDEQKMQETNVNLTRKIVDAAPDSCRIVFASSISVYGKKCDAFLDCLESLGFQGHGKKLAEIPADEKTKTNPDRTYAKTKYVAEKLVSTKPKHVILRIGTLYGKDFADYFYVLKQIEKGKMRIIGDGSNHVPFVHVDDVAKAIGNAVSSIGEGAKAQGIYVLAGEPITQKEVLEIAAKELKVNAPTKKISFKIAHTLASVNQTIARVLGKKPKITSEHIAILGSDRIFDYTKAKKELGFRNRPIAQGIREIVEEYRKTKVWSLADK